MILRKTEYFYGYSAKLEHFMRSFIQRFDQVPYCSHFMHMNFHNVCSSLKIFSWFRVRLGLYWILDRIVFSYSLFWFWFFEAKIILENKFQKHYDYITPKNLCNSFSLRKFCYLYYSKSSNFNASKKIYALKKKIDLKVIIMEDLKKLLLRTFTSDTF